MPNHLDLLVTAAVIRHPVMQQLVKLTGFNKSQMNHIEEALMHNGECGDDECNVRSEAVKLGKTFVECTRESMLDLAGQLDVMVECANNTLDSDKEVDEGVHGFELHVRENSIKSMERLQKRFTEAAYLLWSAGPCKARLIPSQVPTIAFTGKTGGHGVPLQDDRGVDALEHARIHWVGYCENNGVVA